MRAGNTLRHFKALCFRAPILPARRRAAQCRMSGWPGSRAPFRRPDRRKGGPWMPRAQPSLSADPPILRKSLSCGSPPNKLVIHRGRRPARRVVLSLYGPPAVASILAGSPRRIGQRAAATPAPWRWSYGTCGWRSNSLRPPALPSAGGLDAIYPGGWGGAPETLRSTN